MCDVYWIFSDRKQYLEPFNFIDLCKIEYLEIKLFDHSNLCKQMTDGVQDLRKAIYRTCCQQQLLCRWLLFIG